MHMHQDMGEHAQNMHNYMYMCPLSGYRVAQLPASYQTMEIIST